MRLATLLVLIALVLTLQPASADTVAGVGIFGGVGSPTGDQVDLTNDSKSGPHFGFRVPIAFGKFFSLEPFFDRTEGGADQAYGWATAVPPAPDGYDVNAFGVNLGIGKLVNDNGFNIAPYGGVAMHKLRRERGPDDDVFGWRGGLALGLATSSVLHLSLRGEYNSLSEMAGENETRAYTNITLGATCVLTGR